MEVNTRFRFSGSTYGNDFFCVVALVLRYKPEGGFTVRGFGKDKLRCKFAVDKEKDKEPGLMAFFASFFSPVSRAPPSGADPSALSGAKIKEEEDVLHVQDLPTFSQHISQRYQFLPCRTFACTPEAMHFFSFVSYILPIPFFPFYLYLYSGIASCLSPT